MNSHGAGTATAKRLYHVLLGVSHKLDRVVTAEWLSVSISLSAYAQLWHTYTSAADHINDTPKTPGTLASDWLVHLLTLVSYTSLGLELLLVPTYALRMLLAIALPSQPPPTHQQQQQLRQQQQLEQEERSCSATVHRMIAYGSLAPLSLLTLVSNFCGIVDITRAPLLADLLQGIWRLCAVFSAALTLTALPLSLRFGQAPWYLLCIPATASASTASQLSTVLSTMRASHVLSSGYLLWGASALPALALAVQNVRRRLRRASTETCDLVVPLAPVSQLALGIMALGIESRRVWADTVGPSTAPLLLGELAMAAGAILGLLMWAAATAWLVNAHVIVAMRVVPCSFVAVCDRLTESWQVVYPVASFAIATAVMARIWSWTAALLLARFLIAYLTAVIAVLTGRALYRLWTAAVARVRRPRRSTSPTASLYGAI